MVETIFLRVVEMSITAGIVIAFIFAARVLMKRAPRQFSYALWAVALFRLVCPFSFESVFSLIPKRVAPLVEVAARTLEPVPNVPSVGMAAYTPNVVAQNLVASNPITLTQIAAYIWIVGVAALLIYGIVSYIRFRLRLIGAIQTEPNVFVSNRIDTPFVMGIFSPQIYLPASLSEAEMPYILMHERAHIRRFDHIVKIIGFMALAIHWFNPLVWYAFLASGDDMETLCDEAVIKELGAEVKRDYSFSLLKLSTGRKIVRGIPLAFGEGDTKNRVKHVLNYKRPAFWVIAVAALSAVGLSVGLVANPPKQYEPNFAGGYFVVREQVFQAANISLTFDGWTKPEIIISNDFILNYRTNVGGEWVSLGRLRAVNMNDNELIDYMGFISAGLDEKIKSALSNRALVYRNDATDWADKVMIIQQKNGDILLYKDLRLVELEKTAEPQFGDDGMIESVTFESTEQVIEPNDTTDLDAAINKAILDENNTDTSPYTFATASHITLASEISAVYNAPDKRTGGTITVYCMAMYMEFKKDGLIFEEAGGNHMPVAITFYVGIDGAFTLIDYWMPKDGAYNQSSIREKFPVALTPDDWNTQKYVVAQIMSCYNQAIQYYEPDMSLFIERNLATIEKNPALSSSVKAHIDENVREYRQLVYVGDYMLDYSFALFEQGGQTDLKGHIMAAACRDILRVKGFEVEDGLFDTGQDWFDAFKESPTYKEIGRR